MAIKRMDEVLAAIAAGKSNAEIRDEIDGRIGDKAINQLRKHPANADVPWPEDALRYEAEQAARADAPEGARSATKGEQTEGLPTCTTAPQNARAVAEAAAAPAAEEEQVPFVPEPEETVPEETVPETGCTTAPQKTKVVAKVPEWSRMTTGLIEEIDPPMTMATAIRELVRYVMTNDVDHLIEAALAINARMDKEKRRARK